MKELYKVRKIIISLLDDTTNEPFQDIPCEFGIILEREGILFLETQQNHRDRTNEVRRKMTEVRCKSSTKTITKTKNSKATENKPKYN